MIEAYNYYQTSILGVQEVAPQDVNKYGIVDGGQVADRVNKVNGLVEKPDVGEAPSNVAILGRYIINPGIFEILEHTKQGKGGEIQLTDGLKELAQKEAMYAYNFAGKRYDVGNKQGFLEATVNPALSQQLLLMPPVSCATTFTRYSRKSPLKSSLLKMGMPQLLHLRMFAIMQVGCTTKHGVIDLCGIPSGLRRGII